MQTDPDPEELEIARLAAEALTSATRRAVEAGRPIDVVENGELVRIDALGKRVLKKLPARRKVAVRFKRAKS